MNLEPPFGGEVPHALKPGGSSIAPLFLQLRRPDIGVPPDRAPWGTNQRRRLARNRVLLALLLGRDARVDRRNPHYRTPLCAPSDGPLPSGHQKYRKPLAS
jgi:hypothetical protein